MFGLDISDRTLRAASLVRRGKNFLINSINEIDLPSGLIKDGEILKSEAIVPYLKKLIQSASPHKIKSKEVVACLPERQSFIKVIRVSKKELQPSPETIKSEVANHIPFPIDEMYLDWQVINDEPNANAGKQYVLVGAVPKNIVHTYQETLKLANLIPIVLEIESVAITRALLPLDQKKDSEGALIIDLGLDRTSFIIFDRNLVQFTSGITDISGNRLTTMISETLSLSETEAEKAKKLAGFNPKIGKGKVRSALNTALIDLIKNVGGIIDFYREHYPEGNLIKKIILTGGGSNLKLIDQILSNSLKLKVQRGDSLINVEKKNVAFLNPENQVSFATSIGLALRATKNDYS
ncbi:MAG: hypothetical protein COY66_00110 [Candidatus Kerfeldbacteria bacterium CG_4_10_14_0_8_um_filter_42_10]|uniref:SHS2 domain-containing protein n=1 Tax=Candidatus Kerfeldbacteria bacterium CG_4_10_14_0_8_um_filter_42_10 TaxID=2014248 RepID=A0A2M7RL82_9BACT|nr:MAG: hypothetical protein COY66_00110 [Candidatus Kerfeldbacteria bacterium CG_4_10_14_0_8_um_filter_42_10]